METTMDDDYLLDLEDLKSTAAIVKNATEQIEKNNLSNKRY